MGEQRLKAFINFCLHYIADLDIPLKRGTFVEYRTGLINVSPVGRNCSQEEREDFEKYDRQHRVRETFIQALKQQFPDYGLKYSIGGQISFDVFPIGWDKTYCLRYLKDYEEIYFFGDKTEEGGNDHEIYELMRKEGRGFSVREGPKETMRLLE
jgi:phosphomannomutase